MIFRSLIVMLACAVSGIAAVSALERPDVEFQIFQFPANLIPSIDGGTGDWDIVPDSYTIGSDQLRDTEKGNVGSPDPKDLNVRVKVGWVKGMNRLYFLYEADDNYWSMFYRRGDIFEVAVDGDLSGGEFINNPQIPDAGERHYRFKGVHAQNYHIFTPPGEGRDWTMVWGCQPWIRNLPYANHACSYNFREGESGHLVLEFFITPFDHAPFDGPDGAVESKLVENGLIGLSWSVLDYDTPKNELKGFWNLSHTSKMASDASRLVAFRLMPLEKRFRKPIEAEWSFRVIDMDRRLVAFKDLSYGTVTSWLWEFDDGTTSTERNPVHRYTKPGEFVVVLNVEGPDGKARRVKVRDVVIK